MYVPVLVVIKEHINLSALDIYPEQNSGVRYGSGTVGSVIIRTFGFGSVIKFRIRIWNRIRVQIQAEFCIKITISTDFK